MTKVHAFKIASVGSWMEGGEFVTGYGAKQHMNVDADIMELFKPKKDDWLIVWPHGLVTFRDPESFAKDFHYLSGTVFETKLVALFQKGMMSEEGQAQLAVEREQRKENRRVQAEFQRQHALQRRAERQLLGNMSGVLIRQVVPNLLPIPQPFKLS